MKCTDCSWCWKGEDDRFSCCHYPYNDGCAPCEEEEYFEEEEEEE